MGWREDVVRLDYQCEKTALGENKDRYEIDPDEVIGLAKRCNIYPDELYKRLKGIKQGHKHLLADLEAEPTAKEGNAVFKALQKQATSECPDLEKLKQLLEKVEIMNVWIRIYPLIEGPLIDRILQSDQLTAEDLEALRLNVDRTIKQDRSRSKRGANDNARDCLIMELAGIWTDLTRKETNLSAKCGAFIDFAESAADIIGADSDPIYNRFRRMKKQLPGL